MKELIGMKYKAVALDLDGTLTNSDKKITEKTKETLFKAMDRGVKIILASGRPTMGITSIARQLELYGRGGFIMAFNGGEITDCGAGKILSRSTLPPTCTAAVCSAAKAAGAQALTYTENEIVTENPRDEYVLREKRCVGAPVKGVESLVRFVDYEPPKYLIVGPHERLVTAEKILKDEYSSELNIFYSESYFLEVCPKGVSKDRGLAAILKYLGLKRDYLMVCGDGMNDIPMLKYAGLAVAMENSCVEALAEADYVTLSNDSDGAAAAVEKFVLNQ